MRSNRSIAIRCLLLTACLTFAFVFGGCSDDEGSPTGANPPADTNVSGSVVKGPVNGSQVSVYTINANGSRDQLVAGPFSSDGTGAWSGVIPGSAQGPFLAVASGGAYIDEATSGPVTLLASDELLGILRPGVSTTAHVTPMTHVMYLAAVAKMQGSTPVSTAIAEAISVVTTAFGFDMTTTLPDPSGASTEEKQYAALLGGLSTLIDDNVTPSLPNARLFDLVSAIMADLADGTLDALDWAGNQILVDDGIVTAPRRGDVAPADLQPFPALDATGIGALLTDANDYAADQQLGVTLPTDIVLNFEGGGEPTASGEVIVNGSGLGKLAGGSPFIAETGSISAGTIYSFYNAEMSVINVVRMPETSNAISVQVLSATAAPGGESIWFAFSETGVPGVAVTDNSVSFSNVQVMEESTSPTVLNLVSGTLTIE